MFQRFCQRCHPLIRAVDPLRSASKLLILKLILKLILPLPLILPLLFAFKPRSGQPSGRQSGESSAHPRQRPSDSVTVRFRKCATVPGPIQSATAPFALVPDFTSFTISTGCG